VHHFALSLNPEYRYEGGRYEDVAVHVRDYTRFIKLLKWGAIISFLIAMFVIIFVL
jgi:hypothetical protein